jgi:hypothetical protein
MEDTSIAASMAMETFKQDIYSDMAKFQETTRDLVRNMEVMIHMQRTELQALSDKMNAANESMMNACISIGNNLLYPINATELSIGEPGIGLNNININKIKHFCYLNKLTIIWLHNHHISRTRNPNNLHNLLFNAHVEHVIVSECTFGQESDDKHNAKFSDLLLAFPKMTTIEFTGSSSTWTSIRIQEGLSSVAHSIRRILVNSDCGNLLPSINTNEFKIYCADNNIKLIL